MSQYPQDDGLPWGYIAEDLGDWIMVPKIPLLRDGYGPPPFDVKLPDGRIRRVIHQPKPEEY